MLIGLMIRGPLIFRGGWEVGRVDPDSWEGPLLVRGALMIRGPLIMTLAVSGGPLIVTGVLFFWWTQMVRGGADCPDVLFCRFPHRFRDFVRVSVASAGVLALAGIRTAGARKPQGGRVLEVSFSGLWLPAPRRSSTLTTHTRSASHMGCQIPTSTHHPQVPTSTSTYLLHLFHN